MKKTNKSINSLISKIIYFLLIIKISYVFNITLEDVHTAIQELAYSYYMRGKNIQYNIPKSEIFYPEEATPENIKYLVCSVFTKNLFQEFINISIPGAQMSTFEYSRNNLGSPEVIGYSYINQNDKVEMKFYSPNSKSKFETVINPSLDDIIPRLQIGDMLTHSGHTILVYDIIKDKDGKVIDAIIMESTQGIGKGYANSKISIQVTLPNGVYYASSMHYLYLNSKVNPYFEEGLEQGTLGFIKLSEDIRWNNINTTQREKEYSILRFIQEDSHGNAILKYKNMYPNWKTDISYDDLIVLPPKILDKLKFSHIYIEKTINKHNGNLVEIGEILIYKIIIRNAGKKNYNDDLIVTENLSKYITYCSHYENKIIVSFKYDIEKNQLIWNIGKLNKGEEIIIYYYVKITSGKPGDIIESTGLVGNIPSSIIKNGIAVNLNKNQKEIIVNIFEQLKNKYNGKKLINQIYKQAFGIDIKLDKFEITNLIINTHLNNIGYHTIYLNKSDSFYNAVFNNYWSSLSREIYNPIIDEEANVYDLKFFRPPTNPERRQDFIYSENFITGDILIYKNNNDILYSVDKKNNKLINNYVTYEEGEYAYIFIEGKGFVGVNIGDDGKPNTKDDRNEFNAKYYLDNELQLYLKSQNASNELLETLNLQTLYGKDYYVILRPSLCFKFKTDKQTLYIVIIIIFVISIIIIAFIIIRFIKKKINLRKENNDNSLTEGLDYEENNSIY